MKKLSLYILTSTFILASCGGGGSGGSSPNTILNSVPIVNAGNDQTVLAGTIVSLNGEANDTDGQISNIEWQQTSGISVTLTNSNSYNATFTAPTSNNELNLVFKLTVTDNDGGVGSDDVNITVSPDISNVTIETSKKNLVYGDVYTLSWSITGNGTCNIAGEIDATVTESGSMEVTALVIGETETSISCNNVSDSVITKTIPLFIDVPDLVFADVLTRLGYEVIDGQMSGSDALLIDRLCITSLYGYYGDPDENGIVIFDNPNVPDSGVRCIYTGNENETPPLISDTAGLEYFLNLQTMRLEIQDFTTINLNENSELSFLSLWRNPITELDVSANVFLTNLGLSETPLKTIDTSKLFNLEEAAFQGGVFESLDFSQNQKLKRVYLHDNPLTDFGISNNKSSLEELWANNTNIETLDLSGFSKLNYIILQDSENLSYANVYGVSNNQIPFRFYFTNCPYLSEIIVYDAEAFEAKRNTSGFYLDDHINFVEGP